MRNEFQKSLCLSEMVLGERARWAPRSVGVVGDRKVRIWSIQVLVLRTDRVMIGSVLGRECQVLKGVWVRAPWEPPLCVEVGVLLRSPTSSVVSVGLLSVCLLVRC